MYFPIIALIGKESYKIKRNCYLCSAVITITIDCKKRNS